MSHDHPRDVLSLIEAQARQRPHATAILTEDARALGYAAVLDRSAAIAQALVAAAAGAGRPRIGIVLPNGSDLALALLGAMLAGVAVPFNPALGAEDAATALTRSGVDLLLAGEQAAAGPFGAAARRLGITLVHGSAVASRQSRGAPPARPDPDATAIVLMTSGSTGGAKLVPLSHRNICVSAGDVARSMALGPEDHCLVMWEQHHVGGVVDLLLAPFISGGSIVATPGFGADRFFDLLVSARPTWFQGVPATLAELVLNARRRGHRGPGSLRLIRSVAAALPPQGLAELEDVFGVPVIQTFGMTEASPLIASTALPPARRKPGSVGRSCGTAIRILGPDGADLPSGEVGEVAIRGENVFAGYEGAPQANAVAFRDGWFLTGDLGRFDDEGELFLSGRVRQRINRGGEKFLPDEIDAVLASHPAIADVAAFGVPHRRLGDDVMAAVVLRAGQTLSADEARAWVAARLAHFKVPARIVFLDALPRTPVGKVDRPALLALATHSTAATAAAAPARAGDDALASYVARLWAHELELAQVGPDEDFSALGGDSLSSLRIQLALEEAFGLRITPAEARALRTVGSTASFLARRGAKPPRWDPASQLAAVAPGQCDAGPKLDAAYDQLARCQRTRELRAQIDTIVVKAAPAELARLLAAAPRPGPEGASHSRSVGARLNLWLWRMNTRLRLARHRSARAWVRSPVSIHLDLYACAAWPRERKTLVVGFCGKQMRLMLPVWNILVHLDPRSIDLLLLSDPARAHYELGVPGLGHDLPGIAKGLAPHARGYARTIAFGTSAGGLAAVAVAGLNRWHGAVAVGADRPSDHPGIAAVLRGLGAEATPVRLSFGSGRERDVQAAHAIAALLPWAELEPHPGVHHHNLIQHLVRRGRLRSAFGAWFAAAVTIDAAQERQGAA